MNSSLSIKLFTFTILVLCNYAMSAQKQNVRKDAISAPRTSKDGVTNRFELLKKQKDAMLSKMIEAQEEGDSGTFNETLHDLSLIERELSEFEKMNNQKK